MSVRKFTTTCKPLPEHLQYPMGPIRITTRTHGEFQRTDFNAEIQLKVSEKQTALFDMLQDSGCSHAVEREQADSSSNPSFALFFRNLMDLNKFIACAHEDFNRSSCEQTYWHDSDSEDVTSIEVYFNQNSLAYKLSDILFDLGKTNSELRNNQLVCTFDKKILLENSSSVIDHFRCGNNSLRKRDDLPCQAKEEDINWKLWVFAHRGNPDKVQECIDLRANVDYFGGQDKSTTALHQAVDRQDIETCKVLLKASADVNLKTKQWDTNNQETRQPNYWKKTYDENNTWRQRPRPNVDLRKSGVSAFKLAVETGNWKMCKLLIEYGAEIHSKEDEVLHCAVFKDNYSICQELLGRGVKVNTLNKNGQSALFVVRSKKVCDLLIDHGARVDIFDSEGLTPLLSILSSYDHHDTAQIVESLIKAKSDVTKKYPDGTTLFTKALKSNRWEVLKTLVEGGADLEMVDQDGSTPLLCAVSGLQLHIVKVLLKCGANIHAKDKEDNSVLHIWAKSHGFCSDLFQVLLDAGAKTDVLNKDGDTFLHSAARTGNISTCKFLINHGADINAENKDGDTPLHVVPADQEMLQCLIEAGADVLAVNKKMKTPLHCLAGFIPCNRYIPLNQNSKSAIQYLLSEYAFVNAKDEDQNSPLHVALMEGQTDNAMLLIDAGANLHECNKDGRAPLHYAAKDPQDRRYSYNRKDIYIYADSLLEFILKIGPADPDVGEVDVNVVDGDGNTPLHMAANAKLVANCLTLMKAGADALIKNEAGEQPLNAFGDEKPEELDVLLKKQKDNKLKEEGETKLETVKLFLLGEPGAGKTTLRKTLICEGHEGGSKPTPGIDIRHYPIEGAGNFSIWDFAGHEEYHVTHSLFLGEQNAIFGIAYDLSKIENDKEEQQKLQYWLSFVKASRTDKPTVVLIATHRDLMEDKNEAQDLAKDILTDKKEQFEEFLNICDDCIAVNGHESEEMGDLIDSLKTHSDKIKDGKMVPVICEDIKREKSSWAKSDYPVVTVTEFNKKVKQIGTFKTDIVDLALEILHEMGEVYIVTSSQQVVLNVQWFCTEVIGPAFAKPNFPMRNKLKDKMEYTVDDFKILYPNFHDYDDLLIFLEQLELIYKVGDGRYIMPVKLDEHKNKMWLKNTDMTEYYGRRVECPEQTDILSADVFPCLQVRMMKKYNRESEKPAISCNELQFANQVEGYIELIPSMKAIQYYVRGRGEEDRAPCHEMLKEVESMIDAELKERSPGTEIVKKYLKPSDLMGLEDLQKARSYTIEQLVLAAKNDGVVCDKFSNTDRVASIVCQGYDTLFLKKWGLDCTYEWGMTEEAKKVLSQTLDPRNSLRTDYRGLAEACMIPESDLERIENQKSSPTLAVLSEWNKEKQHTIRELLEIISTPGLVHNPPATRVLRKMLREAQPGIKFPSDHDGAMVSSKLPLKLLAQREALRSSSEDLRHHVNPEELIEYLHTGICFTPEAEEGIRSRMIPKGNIGKVDTIIYELLKLKEPSWWEPLMKYARVHTRDPEASPFLAKNLEDSLKYVIAQYDIFKSLK